MNNCESSHSPSAKSEPKNEERRKSLQTEWLDKVIPEPVTWLWEDHVQLGALTLVAGRGNSGKTTFVSDIVATVTNAKKSFCDGKPCRRHGTVLYFTLEGRPANIRNKVEAHGGTLENCGVVVGTLDGDEEGEVDLRETALIEAIITARVAMGSPVGVVVVDPWSDYAGGGIDTNKDNQVRAVLKPILKLAKQCNFAVLVIAHYRKEHDRTTRADDLIAGTAGLVNLARNIFHVMPDPQDGLSVRIAASKSNDNMPAPLLRFRLTETDLANSGPQEWCANVCESIASRKTQYCQWLPSEAGDDTLGADELLRIDNATRRAMGGESRSGKEPTETKRAQEWLQTKLSAAPDGMRQTELEDEWINGERGSKRTLYRAKEPLGVVSQKNGKIWVWSIPSHLRTEGVTEATAE